MERSDFMSLLFIYGKFSEAVSPTRKAYTLWVKYIKERVEFLLERDFERRN